MNVVKYCIATMLTVMLTLADTTNSYAMHDDNVKYFVQYEPIDNGDGSWSLGGISWLLSNYYKNLKDGEVDVLAEKYGKNKPDKPVLMSEQMELSDDEYEILCRIVEAEATGGTIENKRNVTSCILTRVNSPEWPNTIKGVVFQERQFTPLYDGRYYTVTVTESTREAVQLTLQEGLLNDCTYFCSRTGTAYKGYLEGTNWWYRELVEQEEVGDSIHAFFKEKSKNN